MTNTSRYSILQPYKFLVDSAPQIDSTTSEWVASGIHHHLARALDLVAADLVSGRLNLGTMQPSAFRRLRISMDISSANAFGWGVDGTNAPRASFWLPLQERGIRKSEIINHLGKALIVAREKMDKPKGELEFTALCHDLSNHQRIALEGLLQDDRKACDTSA